MKKLFILILSFRAPQALAACLTSLKTAKLPSGWQKKVVVIDNSQKNLGFAAGNNVGLKKALVEKADAVLLLNQDTVVDKAFLAGLLANPADIVGPVIKFKRDGKWLFDFGGKINWWFGRTKHIESDLILSTRYSNPDYISGCAMLIRRPVLEKIGLLDESYFLYFEDVDFCLRAAKAGLKIDIEPQSQIVHRLAAKKSPSSRRYLIASHWWFINRWLPAWRRPLAWLYWLVISVKIYLR